MVHIELVHQFLGPGTVGECTAVAVPHDMTEFVEHDLAGIRGSIMVEPGSLVCTENISSAKSQNTVSGIYEAHIYCSGLAHLSKHCLRCHLVFRTSIAVEPVLIFHQNKFMFRHVYHICEIQEESHSFPAMHRADSYPVPGRASVFSFGVAAIEGETDIPSMPYGLELFPIRIL